MSNPDTTIVLITGANQGIGFQISKKLATDRKDYHIIMTGRRKDAIEAAAAELQKAGLEVESLVLDNDSDESVAAAAKYVDEKFGHLDVLINNTGISRAPSEDYTPREKISAIYNTNVFSTAVTTDAFIPLLKKSSKTKRIVFIGSSIGSLARKADLSRYDPSREDWLAYASSKTAGHYLALVYAARFSQDPTWKVNISCPGHCATNLNGYKGLDDPANGALNAARLAMLGPDGETGTFTNRSGTVPW